MIYVSIFIIPITMLFIATTLVVAFWSNIKEKEPQLNDMKTDHREILNKIMLYRTGISLEEIQKTPLDELRKIFEEKNNVKMKVMSNNLNLISHKEIEQEIERILTENK